MKVTVMNATRSDIWRVSNLVEVYLQDGYADGSRPKQRHCVLYSGNDRIAAVWGGPDHIRVSFSRSTEG